MNTGDYEGERESEILRLMAARERWDRLESELRKLRELNWTLQRISMRSKAEMLLAIEAGEYPSQVAKRMFPQCDPCRDGQFPPPVPQASNPPPYSRDKPKRTLVSWIGIAMAIVCGILGLLSLIGLISSK